MVSHFKDTHHCFLFAVVTNLSNTSVNFLNISITNNLVSPEVDKVDKNKVFTVNDVILGPDFLYSCLSFGSVDTTSVLLPHSSTMPLLLKDLIIEKYKITTKISRKP